MLRSIKPLMLLSTLYILSFSATAKPICNIVHFKSYQMQYCRYAGKEPLLVFIGSEGNDMHVWPVSFLKKLNQFSGLLIYNRIGYGESKYTVGNDRSPITAKATAEQLHALIQSLKIKSPIVLVAHSIGGVYALYYTRRYPHEIAGLIMIDADGSHEPTVNSPFQSKTPEQAGSIGAREADGFNLSMSQVNQAPAFPNIPLLVISATNHGSSQLIEAKWQTLQKAIAKLSPQGKQIIATGSGHFVFEDQPDFMIETIHQFIQQYHLINENSSY